MKTLFTLALFAVSTIAFAQTENHQKAKSSKTIVAKPPKPAKASSGYLKIGDIKGESKRSTTARRRVEVLKSNKQGDPNKK